MVTVSKILGHISTGYRNRICQHPGGAQKRGHRQAPFLRILTSETTKCRRDAPALMFHMITRALILRALFLCTYQVHPEDKAPDVILSGALSMAERRGFEPRVPVVPVRTPSKGLKLLFFRINCDDILAILRRFVGALFSLQFIRKRGLRLPADVKKPQTRV